MERLWGEIVPVPEANVKPLGGGEEVLGMRVAYTPGHASHHVCYLHEESGTAFVGDVAAGRIPPSNLVVPPTPPPDIDIETWLDSIAIVESWRPERPRAHPLRRGRGPDRAPGTVRERLREEADLARELSERGLRAHSAPRQSVAKSLEPRRPLAELHPGGPSRSTSGAAWTAYWRKTRRARSRRSGRPLGQVLAHPLDGLGDALVGRGQRDAEEALAAGPVHRARRDHDGRLFEHQLGRTRSRCGPRGPAPRRRSCPSAR